jgi:hypothetical protein
MEVFKGVVTSSMATIPLKNDSKVRIGHSDIDSLMNAIDRYRWFRHCVLDCIHRDYAQ